MADDTGTGAAQGAAPAQSHGDQSQAQGAAAAPAQGAGAQAKAGDDRGELEARIETLLAENFSYREKLRLQDESQQTADSTVQDQLAELQKQLATEKGQRQEQSLRLATVTAATKLGFRNPELAYRLLDQGAVTFDPEGAPKNVEKLLTDVAKAEPYLVADTDFGGGQRGATPGGKADMNDLIRQAAGRGTG